MILLMRSLSLSGTNAIKLECDYETFNFNSFSCIAKNLQVTKPNEIIDGVVTSHAKGSIIVSMLTIQGQTFNYFPMGIEKIFKKLTGIMIGFSKLKRITQADLKPFTELRILLIYHNEIDILEKDLFKFNTKLTLMNFLANELQHIDSNVLEPLTQLTSVWFQLNTCISMAATTPKKIQELRNKFAQSCQNPDVARKHAEAVGVAYEEETTTNPYDRTTTDTTELVTAKPTEFVTAKPTDPNSEDKILCKEKCNQTDHSETTTSSNPIDTDEPMHYIVAAVACFIIILGVVIGLIFRLKKNAKSASTPKEGPKEGAAVELDDHASSR